VAARWRRLAGPAADPKECPLSPASPRQKRRANQLTAWLQASPNLSYRSLGILEHVKAAIGEEEIRLLVGDWQRS
jgi:hypothetical protein